MHPAVVLLLVGVLNAMTAQSVSTDLCDVHERPCGDGWFYISEKDCVKYFEIEKTFQEAEDDCMSHGGGLVSINDPYESQQIVCFTRFSNPYPRKFWIGVRRSEGEFRNLDGSPLGFAAWHVGQPDDFGGDEDCAESNFKDWGLWNDAVCTKVRPYVCMRAV